MCFKLFQSNEKYMKRIKAEEKKNFQMKAIYVVPHMVIPEVKTSIINILRKYWKKIIYLISGGMI